MKRLALSLATLSILVAGCAAATAPHAPATAAATSAPASAESAGASKSASRDEAEPAAVAPAATLATDAAGSRAPGDFVVFRFTGSFHDAPLTLEQRVIAREGESIVVLMTLDDRGRKEALRVTMSDASATRGEVLGVARVQGSNATAATTAD